MLIEALFAAGDLGRLNEIARVLIRHGFGGLVQRTGLARWLVRAGGVLHWEAIQHVPALTSAQRLRTVLEELGPIFVKLGQLLASRSDILPPDWARELRKLHEGVPALPWESLREQLTVDLGAAPEERFAAIETEPLAAGSIAQVHRARLADGTEVVLKIRRPHIDEKARADLRLLLRLAELLERELPDFARFQPRRIVKDFQRTMRAELDLRVEARNMQAIAEALADEAGLVIPRTHEAYCGTRLLVMDYLDGLSAAEWIAGERPAGLDPVPLVRLGARLVVQMIFAQGLYHADPHPGNVLFLVDGRIGLLDFGMVGRISEGRRREFVELLAAVVEREEEAVAERLLAWSGTERVDYEALLADVRAFLDRYHGVELGRLDVTALLLDVTEIVRENALVLPADVAMLIKVFLTLEGLGRELDESFEIASFVEPEARRLRRSLGSARSVLRRNWRELRGLLLGLPADLRTILGRMRRGGFRVELDLERLDSFGNQLERSANRITVALITASLIVGTSIAMTVDEGPRLLGMPALGLLGFLCSGVIGALLMWSVLRSRGGGS